MSANCAARHNRGAESRRRLRSDRCRAARGDRHACAALRRLPQTPDTRSEPGERRRQRCGFPRRQRRRAPQRLRREPQPGALRPPPRGSWRWQRQRRPAPPPSTPGTRSEPGERRRQMHARWRPQTAPSAAETAPRAAAGCAATAAARPVAMAAPAPASADAMTAQRSEHAAAAAGSSVMTAEVRLCTLARRAAAWRGHG